MFIQARVYLVLAAFLGSTVTGSPQQVAPAAAPASGTIKFNVVVAPKSGPPVSDLQQQDFKVFDNKAPRPITSFKAVSKGQEPVEVILLIDAVNIGFDVVARVREEVKKSLLVNGGRLAHPTTIAVLTDKGTQMQKGFSTDGNELSASLDHYTIGLRDITRASGIWGANERFQISQTAVRQLIDYAASLPGRKMILWVSPGWPLLSGAGVQLDTKQQQQVFGNIVGYSALMRQANATFYDVNPLGAGESVFRASFYDGFVKGVSKPSQTDLADLSLQVLAIQSGGLTIDASNDVSGMLARCLADADSWYEITVDAAAAERPNEYHHIEITVDKPGLIARTRDGYYTQP